MESGDSVETQKAAFDGVDGGKSISEAEIRKLFTQYGKLLGKERIVRVAGGLANQLITVVGVETYNDLRHVTFEIYADRCGVTLIDAALLVHQFGIPVVPPVDNAAVEQVISGIMTSFSPPKQEAKEATGHADGDLYEAQGQGGGIAVVHNPLHGPQRDALRSEGALQGVRSSTLQSLGQGLQWAQSAGNSKDDVSRGVGSMSTHLTAATAPSQAQSLQESLAQSMVQLSQAMVASAAHTQALVAQGVGRLPVLKPDGRNRPKVKAVKTWIKDLGDKKFQVKGFAAALDLLRRAPEKMQREDFAEIYISEEDDRAMYAQIKASMSEVYDMMSTHMARVERQSTMGLIYDAMMFAIRKDQQVIAMKVN